MPEHIMAVEFPSEVTNKILAHYDVYARVLPWRSPPGSPPPDPYAIWLSEIMLQQTTVAAVKPYFEHFLKRWPDVTSLASAPDADVMAAWAGLGYYARARNLLACARAIVAEYGGGFPDDEEALKALPGVGPYTAAAITAIAFGHRATVVDGNVERVIARLHAVVTPMPQAKPELKRLAQCLTPDKRSGDFAQAMMDLGATICTPRNPNCQACPITGNCKGQAEAELYPVKPARKAKPHRSGTAWWIECNGEVLLVRRPEKGLLGGMRALPSCGWNGDPASHPVDGMFQSVGSITHVFTHFTLTLDIVMQSIGKNAATALDGEWWAIDRLDEAGLPSLFEKAAGAVKKWRLSHGP